jgi:hypothetical protein
MLVIMRRASLLLAMLLGLAAGPAIAQRPAPPIAGVWRFQREIDTRPDGSVVQILPADGWDGYAIYTLDGFVSINIMPKGRKWKVKTATLKELRRTLEDGSAYFGRYTIDAAAGTVTHLVHTSVEPEFEHKHLVRRYAIDGDTLTLTGSSTSNGETLTFTIRWQRER